jgi:hypothetical protein
MYNVLSCVVCLFVLRGKVSINTIPALKAMRESCMNHTEEQCVKRISTLMPTLHKIPKASTYVSEQLKCTHSCTAQSIADFTHVLSLINQV